MRDIAGKYVWDATHIYGLTLGAQTRSLSPPPSRRIRAISEDIVASGSAVANSKTRLDFLAKVSLRLIYGNGISFSPILCVLKM